jgi:hypothetical protein
MLTVFWDSTLYILVHFQVRGTEVLMSDTVKCCLKDWSQWYEHNIIVGWFQEVFVCCMIILALKWLPTLLKPLIIWSLKFYNIHVVLPHLIFFFWGCCRKYYKAANSLVIVKLK